MLNIFLGTKNRAVNKIGRDTGSQGSLFYIGGERQVNNVVSQTYAVSDGGECCGNQTSREEREDSNMVWGPKGLRQKWRMAL